MDESRHSRHLSDLLENRDSETQHRTRCENSAPFPGINRQWIVRTELLGRRYRPHWSAQRATAGGRGLSGDDRLRSSCSADAVKWAFPGDSILSSPANTIMLTLPKRSRLLQAFRNPRSSSAW